MSALIKAVLADSLAAELEIEVNDRLLSIDGLPITDMIDYSFAIAESELLLEIEKPDGIIWEIELEKDPDQDLGLSFEAEVFDGIKSCHNHCLFCFIDQLQPHPRPTLLIKDDDYRMSFLEGNFITGTNLTEQDIARIGAMHLSPIYISVHATDADLRTKMLGRKKPAPILPLLKQLIELGITVHSQIVLCPGINDGAYLKQTLDDLIALHPGIASIAIVPVGITCYQTNPQLRLFTKDEAKQLLTMIKTKQDQLSNQFGENFIFAADELYIKAELPFPSASHYQQFEQIENGVGMAAYFLDCWQKHKNRLQTKTIEKTALLTGHNGQAVLDLIAPDIKAALGSNLQIVSLQNIFYGANVTATGLLTGTCLSENLKANAGKFSRYLIPSSMLKFNSDAFLDDLTIADLAKQLNGQIIVIEPNAEALIEALNKL